MCHWIGDNFWSIQVIPAIKKKYPNSKIYVGIKGNSKDLLCGLIDEDKIIILNNVISDRHREKFNLREYRKELNIIKQHNFDLGVDLTGNRYSALFLFLSRVKERVGLDLHKLSFLYNIKGGKIDYTKHLINRPFETVNVLFPVGTPELLMKVKTNFTKVLLQKEIDFSLRDKIALLMPGAGWIDKQWSINNFIKVGQYLSEHGYTIVVAGSKQERILCEEIVGKINSSFTFIRPLKEFISLILYIDIAITNDSGPAHLLAAANVKTITLFSGNTDQGKCGPLGENVNVVKFKNKDEGLEGVVTILDSLMKK